MSSCQHMLSLKPHRMNKCQIYNIECPILQEHMPTPALSINNNANVVNCVDRITSTPKLKLQTPVKTGLFILGRSPM